MTSSFGLPSNPTIGTTHVVGDSTYVWTGVVWNQVTNQVTQEQVQDIIAPLLVHNNHTNITASYDDINNLILLNGSEGGGGGATDIALIIGLS
jgi:hypothetical protein